MIFTALADLKFTKLIANAESETVTICRLRDDGTEFIDKMLFSEIPSFNPAKMIELGELLGLEKVQYVTLVSESRGIMITGFDKNKEKKTLQI